jgi:hypothetical protein
LKELAARRAMLQLRCAAQRRAVVHEGIRIASGLRPVDRVTAIARAALLHPALAVAGAAGLLVLGRVGGLRLISRGLLFAAALGRLRRLARML